MVWHLDSWSDMVVRSSSMGSNLLAWKGLFKDIWGGGLDPSQRYTSLEWISLMTTRTTIKKVLYLVLTYIYCKLYLSCTQMSNKYVAFYK